MSFVTAEQIIEHMKQLDDDEVTVQQTGGGTATMFVGTIEDANAHADPDGTERYRLVMGPGSFNWEDPELSRFDWGDLYVGPDDGGEAVPHRVLDWSTFDHAVKHHIRPIPFHVDAEGRVPGAVGMEARCDACGETFNPHGGREELETTGDYIGKLGDEVLYRHYCHQRDDGELVDCGGVGRLVGAWGTLDGMGSTSPEPPTYAVCFRVVTDMAEGLIEETMRAGLAHHAEVLDATDDLGSFTITGTLVHSDPDVVFWPGWPVPEHEQTDGTPGAR